MNAPLTAPIAKPEIEFAENEFKRRLVELGLMKEVKSAGPSCGLRPEPEPIAIEGIPLSEQIIQERR